MGEKMVEWVNGYTHPSESERERYNELRERAMRLRQKRLNEKIDEAPLSERYYNRNLSVEENLQNRRRKLEETWKKREKKAFFYNHGVYEK
jgi:hypothetical protein